jgi:hypothetical protein
VPDDIEAGTMEKLIDLLFQSPGVNRRQSAVSSHAPDAQSADLDHLPAARTYFVANKNSEVYHCEDCKWSKKIKSDNIMKFSSAQEAEAQNFLPCSSCKPDRLPYGDHLDSKTEKIKSSSYR